MTYIQMNYSRPLNYLPMQWHTFPNGTLKFPNNFTMAFNVPQNMPCNRINYFMEWNVPTTSLHIVLVPEWKCWWGLESPLVVERWRILARQFCAPCPAQQQHQQGETQSEERIWPLQNKIALWFWFWSPLGCPWVWNRFGSVLNAAASAERRDRATPTPSHHPPPSISPPSLLLPSSMCHNWFRSQ